MRHFWWSIEAMVARALRFFEASEAWALLLIVWQ